MVKCEDCEIEANEEYMYWRTEFNKEPIWRCKECDDNIDKMISEFEDKFNIVTELVYNVTTELKKEETRQQKVNLEIITI